MQSVKLRIEKCDIQDIQDVQEIENVSFNEPYPYSVFLDLLRQCPQAFLVAKEGKRVVGYCVCARAERPDTIILASIAVHPSFRRTGIGRKLLVEVIDKVRHEIPKIKRLTLQVRTDNYAAIKLYEGMGFDAAVVIRDYYGNGKDGIEMTLDL